MKTWWHSGPQEKSVGSLRASLAKFPEDWMIRPTEFGWRARAPEESPDKPLILNAQDLSTIETWAMAAHHHEALSDHERILLSKVEAMKARQEI